jgi:alkanesulfonate monooxygenase SsuD/methylene tetrahydromethanopterin reductase-like flavin-dependent oxidoreductase (luciferase family)
VTLGAVGDGREPAGLAGLAALAEASGWDAVFLEDYLDYQGMGLATYDPWVCLAAMAAATGRIRLGTTVTPVPRRRPWELAAQAVAVDHLSAGRLILGVGAGDVSDPGFAAVGEPARPRVLAARLDEGLEIISRLWTGSAVHYAGEHYRISGLRLAATPVQRPRIPIWVGGDLRRPGVRRRLTRWDGACVYRERPLDPDDVRDILDLVRRERGGTSGFEVKVSGNPHLVDEFAAAGAAWWGRWIAPGDIAEARQVIAAGPPA